MQHRQVDGERQTLLTLIQQLVQQWSSSWDNNDYPGEILPRLLKDPSTGIGKEKDLLEKIRKIASSDEWKRLPQMVREEHELIRREQELWPELHKMIRCFQLDKAEVFFQHHSRILTKDKYETSRRDRIERRRHSIQEEIQEPPFKEAEQFLEESCGVLTSIESQEIHEWFQSQATRAANVYFQKQVVPLLVQYDFAAAQEVFQRTRFLSAEQFMNLMGHYVQSYFRYELKTKIDLGEAKAKALSTVSQRTLVRARAGSGKTMLLACLVKLLVEKLGVSHDQILVMAFNRDAACEIKNRIRNDLDIPKFTNARTFHSLAWHLAPPEGKRLVLADDRLEESWEKSRTQLLESIWKDLRKRRPRLWLLAYLMFRKEATLAEPVLDPDSEEYLLYRRNICEASLKGESVKSKGEKYIADFLLEHDIPYSYERAYFWENGLYHPDFTLFIGQHLRVILEHWAIDPNDCSSTVPHCWEKSTAKYRDEIQRKRGYWRKKELTLLETNARQVRKLGREGFEKHLKSLLGAAGIGCHKLPREQVMKRISDSRSRRLVQLFGQLISRAKKAGLLPTDVKRLYHSSPGIDARTRAFYHIGWRVYRAYEEALIGGKTDYDSLMRQAAHVVKELHGNIQVRDGIRGAFSLAELKWLLIDEFQDFSRLFSELVESIAKWNPNLRIFSVGDDWQAINGFAGSNLRFMQSFTDDHANSISVELPINRRSSPKIIEAGNRFMRWTDGQPAKPLLGKEEGEIRALNIDNTDIDMHNEEDKPYRVERNDSGELDVLTSKYLKLVGTLIAENPERRYSILTRTHRIRTVTLEDFEKRLIYCLERSGVSREDQRVDVSTIHSYKGRQSDVTIVLQVVDRQFPLIHPDWVLFAPLGDTIQGVIDEERRLFYVAISRAKDEVILVTEKQRESRFVADALGNGAKGGRI